MSGERGGTLRGYLVGLIRPESRGQDTLPRVDLLIMTFTVIAGIVLVAMDIFQRWIWHRPIETLNIDGAANIETWVHTVILGGASLAALGIAFTFFDNRNRLCWLVAGLGIAFLSLDKATGLHERFGDKAASVLGLPESAARVVWIVGWSPIIISVAAALIVVVWGSPAVTKMWVGFGLFCAASKIAMEALMFPVLYYGATSYTDNIHSNSGWGYGIEVLFEESIQLIAFAAFFAAFAQLLVDRLLALSQQELAAPVSAVSLIKPAATEKGDVSATPEAVPSPPDAGRVGHTA